MPVILFLTVVFAGCQQASDALFVPDAFDVPEVYESGQFRLRPLQVADAEKDYEAVMASRSALRQLFNDEWPADEFTLAENKEDLAQHAAHFAAREGFTYTVAALDESEILGCVYIYPGESPSDALVIYWIRSDRPDIALGFGSELVVWLENAWPFESVTYLGTEEG